MQPLPTAIWHCGLGRVQLVGRPIQPEIPSMIDPRLAPHALLLLRVSLGVMFIAHAWLKLAVFTVPGFAGFLGQVGLPGFLAWPIILAELLGGIALILGVYARAVALALLPVLLGALAVHAGNGWVFNAPNGGWEYPAFLAVAALVQALAGDGSLALVRTKLPTPAGRQGFTAAA
jgi:putative oxidoreductase